MDVNRKRPAVPRVLVVNAAGLKLLFSPQTARAVHKALGELLTDHAADKGRGHPAGCKVVVFEQVVDESGIGFSTDDELKPSEVAEFARRCRT